MDNENDTRDIHWSDQLENLIASEGEKCRGLAWLHLQSEQLATSRNNGIQLPVIILSTLAGVASTASSTLFNGETKIASIITGLISIGVGILNTIGSFFAFARKSEGHHIAYLNYSKLFSWISVELALPREERQTPPIVLKQLRDAMERLSETTPLPPPSILLLFQTRFKEYKGKVALPTEVNGLQKITVYRNEHTQRGGARNSTDSLRDTPSRQTVFEIETQQSPV